MKRSKPIFNSDSYEFIMYSVGFFLITFFFGKYLFTKSINEYLIFMIVCCPLSYWIYGKVKNLK